eukprot:7380652-Prymnesium_polylepis.1
MDDEGQTQGCRVSIWGSRVTVSLGVDDEQIEQAAVEERVCRLDLLALLEQRCRAQHHQVTARAPHRRPQQLRGLEHREA